MNRLFCILLVTLTITACAHVTPQAQRPQPPVAQRIAHADTLHGVVVQDPYHWLKDKSRTVPGVLSYVEAENAYAEAWMKPLAALEDSLFEEIIGRIAETDLSVPDKEDGWYYYSRRSEGLQYPIFCRRQGSMDAPEQIYLDMNEFEVWALRDIEAGHALTMDYASTEDILFRQFPCLCGTPNCRNWITGRKEEVNDEGVAYIEQQLEFLGRESSEIVTAAC